MASGQRAAVIVALVALAGAALAIWATGGEAPDEEDRVRQAIQEVVSGAERADLKQTMAPISTGYHDDEGLSRDNLKGYLFMEFRRRGPVHTLLSPIQVTLAEDGRTAQASFTAALGEGGAGVVGELLPQTGDVIDFDVALKKEGEAWRITAHERYDLDGDRVRLPGG